MGYNNFSLNSVSCPCRGCDVRTPECHGTCDLYARYKEEYADAKKQETEIRDKDRLGMPLGRRRASKR